MRASKWVIQKIIGQLKGDDVSGKLDEIDRILARYPDDDSLKSIHKELKEYRKSPSKAKLNSISKKLDEILKTRKFEASGGTRLWFGDRRKTRSSQASR